MKIRSDKTKQKIPPVVLLVFAHGRILAATKPVANTGGLHCMVKLYSRFYVLCTYWNVKCLLENMSISSITTLRTPAYRLLMSVSMILAVLSDWSLTVSVSYSITVKET